MAEPIPIAADDVGERIQRTYPALYAIIALNVIVYIITSAPYAFMQSTEWWIMRLGFIPILFFTNPAKGFIRMFTAMFTHANILHIFFNMYFLYIFGKGVEAALGSRRFLALYLLSGIASMLFHAFFTVMQGPEYLAVPAVGASGAISGVLGAYMVLYPTTKLAACFFIPLPVCFTMSALWFILTWFILQAVLGFIAPGSGIAFFAHVGGFVAGVALLALLANRERIQILRYLAHGGRWVLHFIVIRRPRGLSPAAKALYTLVVLGLLAAAGWTYAATAVTGMKVADLNLYSRVGIAGQQTTQFTYELVLALENGRALVPEAPFMPDLVRVVVTRLYMAGILYNPQFAGRTIHLTNVEKEVAIPIAGCGVVKVPVVIDDLIASYTRDGILASGRGVVDTRIVYVSVPLYSPLFGCTYRMGPPARIWFVAVLQGVALLATILLPLLGFVVVCSLGSLYTIYARPDLSIA